MLDTRDFVVSSNFHIELFQIYTIKSKMPFSILKFMHKILVHTGRNVNKMKQLYNKSSAFGHLFLCLSTCSNIYEVYVHRSSKRGFKFIFKVIIPFLYMCQVYRFFKCKRFRGRWGKGDTLNLNPCVFLPIDSITHPLL